VDLAGLVQPGVTLAIYMGIAMLRPIHDALLAEGMAATMPAAVIERGGTPGQRVLRGTLAEMLAQAPGWVTEGPALLLVGAAVGRATPAWASAA